MAKRVPDPEPVFESVEENDLDALQDVLSSLPEGGVQIFLYRHPAAGTGRPAFVGELTPEEFSPGAIQRQWGGGRFRLKVVKAGSGTLKQSEFVIEGPPRVPAPVVDQQKVEGGSPASDHLEKLNGMIEKLLSKQSDDLMKMVMTLLLSRSQEKPSTSSDELEEKILARLSTYKSLFSGGGNGDQSGMLRLMLETLKEGMSLGASGEGGSSPWLTLAERAVPLVEKVLTAPRLRTGPAPAPAPAPAPTPAQNSSTNPGPTQSSGPVWLPYVEGFLPVLLGAASRNSDPDLYADMILDNVPPAMKAPLLTWLKTPEWFQALTTLDNRISLQAGWWTELRDALLTDEDTHAETRESESGAGAGQATDIPA